MNIRALNSPENAKLVDARVAGMMQTGSAVFESAHRRKDGTVMPVEVSACLIELGGQKLILSSSRDITERKRAEAALRESEEKFRVIVDHARDGILVISIEAYSVRLANASMERFLGYGPGELNGLPMARFHPPEMLAQVGEQFDKEVSGGQSFVQDMPMQSKDGRVVYADLSS